MEGSVEYMKLAFRAARRGAGKTSPNPMVGAAIVRDGRVLGSGWHRGCGGLHAEAEAVRAARAAGEATAGADLYCTLEPCCWSGPDKKQPPCTGLIVECGIRRVFVANLDPHPKVSGRGVEALRAAGIAVEAGLRADEGEELNRGFFAYQRTGLPFVHVKIAQTLDGRIAAESGDARWITDERARREVHRLRAFYDAVLVGRGTILADDPELTVRLVRGRNPFRAVLDSRLSLPDSARVLNDGGRDKTILLCAADACGERIQALRLRGVRVMPVEGGLREALAALGGLGIRSVLVEGGSRVFSSFVREGLWDRLSVFVAPVVLGGGVGAVSGFSPQRVADGMRLKDVRIRRLGDQAVIEGERDVYGHS
ncbi:MAG: bifunctional diaminohydroxyphosphoribosylaminopyrimidine deaminase/5-amino-6-(5-phosphoribosylamino)uracil reductase RibD [Spirochaetaceae bacterium]|nr:bifunctional diaminohydroxyphosphoribosylaminopyrimidine deaminase/5-amino-6-(5-phosphoribosylamino)uracil reductase RibD [Spirochaetaceae bacterium]